jgi:AcrR family transcriptional regulator
MAKRTRPFIEKIDARTTRKDRSRQAILGAYIELVNETRRQPTALQIAERAGCSLRLIFQHFADLASLTLAAAQIGYQQARARADAAKLDGDRQTRIRTHIERRAHNCETWLPLWSIAVAVHHQSTEMRRLGGLIRKATLDRLAEMYAPELACHADVDRRRLLIALEAITDYESWGRLRDDHGLSVEQASASWVAIIDRLLPPTPVEVHATPKRPTSKPDELSMPVSHDPLSHDPLSHDPLGSGGEIPLAF